MNEELFDIRPPIVEDLQPASIYGYEDSWSKMIYPDWDI